MKKQTYLLSLLLILSYFCQAQAPQTRDGQSYTLTTLCTEYPEAVQCLSPNHFHISQNLTLLAPDTLILEANDEKLSFSDGVIITISGTLLTADRIEPILIQGDSARDQYFELRFENAAQSLLSKAHIQFCKRILLINSNIMIRGCEFDHFSDHVVSYMNCSPIIENCLFHDNQSCAIQSAVNTDGCPQILYNTLYNNVLGNTNNPQINIGPGTTDTIRIIGNRIEGVASNMSGGIGIMNMYNPDVTHLLLKDNVITRNRYGYTQNGYRISSEILDNQFIDNNLEVNPNNGGSGVSIYGYDTTCTAKMRRNLITGNLWGVTAIYYHHLDMGTTSDYGYNLLYNNGNNGVDYELFNNANSELWAVGNYWGCDSEEAAEEVIFHQFDDASYGLVHYTPIYVPSSESVPDPFLTEINLVPNPVSNGYFTMENPTGEILKWQIFSSNGQRMMFGEAQPGTCRIVTKGLRPGVYFVQIQKANTFVTRKLVVQ